jgi:hypothetical protein
VSATDPAAVCAVCPPWRPCSCAGGPTRPTLAVAGLLRPTAPRSTAPSVPAVQRPRIDIRAKGANGEREVAKTLIAIIQDCMRKEGFTQQQILEASQCVQRNQNQSAVGGNDLSHTFGMSIEVKRQEALSINSWWAQCVAAAKPNAELPVLVYRQNNRPWRVVTLGSLHLPGTSGSDYGSYAARVEFEWDVFKSWFGIWVTRKLLNGELPRGVKTQ